MHTWSRLSPQDVASFPHFSSPLTKTMLPVAHLACAANEAKCSRCTLHKWTITTTYGLGYSTLHCLVIGRDQQYHRFSTNQCSQEQLGDSTIGTPTLRGMCSTVHRVHCPLRPTRICLTPLACQRANNHTVTRSHIRAAARAAGKGLR